MHRHSRILHCARGPYLTLPSFPPRGSLCRAIRRRITKIGRMKRGDRGRAVESREPTMGDALVTHDGLRGHTAEKMYIHSDAAKDMVADRGGGERGLTDVSLCRVCYLHYFDIIIPVALYLTAPSLFCSDAHPVHRCATAHIVRCEVLLYQSFRSSFLFFFFLFLNFLWWRFPFACCCTCTRSRRLQHRMPLIALILLYVQWGIFSLLREHSRSFSCCVIRIV